jgi:hypothetical protein
MEWQHTFIRAITNSSKSLVLQTVISPCQHSQLGIGISPTPRNASPLMSKIFLQITGGTAHLPTNFFTQLWINFFQRGSVNKSRPLVAITKKTNSLLRCRFFKSRKNKRNANPPPNSNQCSFQKR